MAPENGPSRKKIILVHGYTGSPRTMEPLAAEFEKRGYEPVYVELAGHGKDIGRLPEVGFSEMYRSMLEQIEKTGMEPKVIAAYSAGGVLSLRYAFERASEVEALLLIAPAMQVSEKFVSTVRRLKSVGKWAGINNVSKKSMLRLMGKRYKEAPGSADYVPLGGSLRLFEEARPIRHLLPGIDVPAFIVHGNDDPFIPPECAQNLYDALGTPPEKKILHCFDSGPGRGAVADHDLPCQQPWPPLIAELFEKFRERLGSRVESTTQTLPQQARGLC